MECVVKADGTVGDIKIVQSLDPRARSGSRGRRQTVGVRPGHPKREAGRCPGHYCNGLHAEIAMPRPRINALAISCVVHAIVIGVLLVMSSGRASQQPAHRAAHYEPPMMVWLPVPGPGGGGGGGGNNNPNPPRAAELQGTDTKTVPAAPRGAPETVNEQEPQPTQSLDVPVQTFAASDLNAMGLLEAGADSLSQGPGREGRAGTGRATRYRSRRWARARSRQGRQYRGRYLSAGQRCQHADRGSPRTASIHARRDARPHRRQRGRRMRRPAVGRVHPPSCRAIARRPPWARPGGAARCGGLAFLAGVRQGKAVPVLVTIMLGFAIH